MKPVGQDDFSRLILTPDSWILEFPFVSIFDIRPSDLKQWRVAHKTINFCQCLSVCVRGN